MYPYRNFKKVFEDMFQILLKSHRIIQRETVDLGVDVQLRRESSCSQGFLFEAIVNENTSNARKKLFIGP